VVLLVLAGMAVVAVTAMSGLTTGGSATSELGLSNPSAPLPTTRSSGPPATTSFEALAKQVACKAAYQSVVAADDAEFAQSGYYADTVSQLVSDGYLPGVPSPSAGYTIGLAYTTPGKGRGRNHGADNGGRDPTGDVTVNGAVGSGACDRL